MTDALPCPYKGPETFNFADRPLYFGRDRARRLVRVRIEAQPVFILTGPSGCGKSSLLRAGILPDLMSAGWAVAYAHPGNGPEAAMATELARQAYPHREREGEAIAAVQRHGPFSLQEPSALLSDVRAWFASRPPTDAVRQAVCNGDAAPEASRIQRLPFVAQAVAGLLDDETLRRRLGGPRCPGQPISWDEVRALVDSLPSPPPPSTDLQQAVAEFMERAPDLGYSGLVLVLDQAEELFTRYRGTPSEGHPQKPNVPGFQARLRLFDALMALTATAFPLPLRLCVSLRPEWFTHLRIGLPDLDLDDLAVHHLQLLTREEADAALCEPARLLGAEFEQGCAEWLLEGLVEDDRIDPFLLAVTGELVWRTCAPERESVIRSKDVHDALKLKSDQTKLSGAALKCLLDEALKSRDTAGKFDMLETLGRLATEDGTRTFRSREELVSRPLRRPERLEQALKDLAQARLIRISKVAGPDGLLRSQVEVRHDRLLGIASARLNRLRDGADGSEGAEGQPVKSEPDKSAERRSELPGVLELLQRLRVLPLDIYEEAFPKRLPGYSRPVLKSNLDLLELDSTLALLVLAGMLDDEQGGAAPSVDGWATVLRAALEGPGHPADSGHANGADYQLQRAVCRGDSAALAEALRAFRLAPFNQLPAKPGA